MRVVVAGATGAIGRPLVAALMQRGDQVVGLTRAEDRARELRALGAEAIVVDALDADAVRAAVVAAAPEAVVDQLTSLPHDYKRLKKHYPANTRLRRDGSRHLLAGAVAAGARCHVLQSISFITAPEGPAVLDEDAPLYYDAPEPFGEAVRVFEAAEGLVTGAQALAGTVLRYGFLYGPGTFYAADGSAAADVRRRRYPLLGDAGGVVSFVHVDDAAGAVLAVLDGDAGGRVLNVCDDDPAPTHDWLGVYARALGAKPPRRVPLWVGHLVAGAQAVHLSCSLRGASNARAKETIGWIPRWPTWREGLPASLRLGGQTAAG